jgi:hypothetical protein
LLNFVFARALESVYTFIKWSAAFVTERISVTVSLKYPFFPVILILLGVLLLFLRLRSSRSPLALLGVFIACATVFGASVPIYGVIVRNRAEICYLANKSSEGILVNSGNDTLFIDVGNGSKSIPTEGIELARGDAFVIGNEGHGLSPQAVEAANGVAIIPMTEGSESLNAAAAAAICIWETVQAK